MKTFRLAALMFLSIVFGLMLFVDLRTVDAQHQDGQKKEKILFHWAFGAFVKAEHGSNLVAITRDTELKTGILKTLKLKGLAMFRSFYLIRDRRRIASPLCQAMLDVLLASSKVMEKT